MSKQIFISSGGEDIAKITHYPDTGRVELDIEGDEGTGYGLQSIYMEVTSDE